MKNPFAKDNTTLVPHLHKYLNTVKFMRTPSGQTIDTNDLFMTFLKSILTKFKKDDREAVIALLEIAEKEFFVGINDLAKKALEVTETKFTIGQGLKNRKGEVRFIIEIVKESKKGELQYGWASADGVTSICSEKTLTGWIEK